VKKSEEGAGVKGCRQLVRGSGLKFKADRKTHLILFMEEAINE
jgi:hypothetical protein